MCGKYGLTPLHNSITVIPMKLRPWMDLTGIDFNTRQTIKEAMQRDICDGVKTGFEPYSENGEIMFAHKWLLWIARK